MESCPGGTTISGTQCVACEPPCATCSGTPSTCLSCWTGQYLHNTSCCSAGQIWTGACTDCPAGTFAAPDAFSCIECPPGSSSNVTASHSSAVCVPCSAGSYSASAGSSSCTSCPIGTYCPTGTTSGLPQQPTASAAYSQDSSASSGANSLSAGYVFLVVYFVVATIIGIVVLAFRAKTRFIVAKFAAVMRTPRWLLHLDIPNERVKEPPSLIRGLIGIWVLLGVLLVTLYQIYNFAENQYGTLTTLQPGTTFSNGQAITSAATQLSATVVLFASPVSCSSLFAAALGSTSLKLSCQASASSTTLTFMTASATQLVLSPTSTIDLTLTITAPDDNVVFAPVLQYTFSALQYDGSSFAVNETLVGSSTMVLTGTTTVSLAAVAAEQQDIDGVVTATGYTVSYISTTPATAQQPGTSLGLVFEMSVPSYYLKVQQIQAISVITFLSGIAALGGAVIAAGTLLAFVYSYVSHHFFDGALDSGGYELSQRKTTSSFM